MGQSSTRKAGRLRILATSDLHMQLRSFDYFTDKPIESAGMTRLATLMRETREKAKARGDVVITLDNGDSLQGTPLEEQALRDMAGPHIFYRALNLMQYDAAGLGNHDFNFDLDSLEASLRDAPVPILCTNARRVDGGQLPVHRWTVLDRELCGHSLKIGVFSVLPPQTLIWDADHLTGHMTIDDIMSSARDAIATLRSEGCDIIIALAHTGLGEPVEETGQENALWPLTQMGGLDAVVAGHTHLLLPDPHAPEGSDLARGVLHGTPVVMPGAGGGHLGIIDLDLAHDGRAWQVIGKQAQLRPAETGEDAALSEMTAPLHRATRSHLAQSIGHTPLPLHSYFGFLAPSPALALVAAAKAHALSQLGALPDGLPILSSVAPAKMGGRGGPDNYVNIPAGPLSLRHVFDLCFFPNRMAGVIVTGAQLADWIEMSAGLYNQITPGQPDQPLLDPERPAHGSDIFYGVEYELDLSQPSRFTISGDLVDDSHRRLVRLEYQGKPVAADDRFAVALSSYRANGGGNIAALRSAERIEIPHLLVRDALRTYLQDGCFPDWAQQQVCRFTPLGQTTVLAASSPDARAHLDELGPIFAGEHGIDKHGFLQLRLTL
ncbi:5'-nucleotidase C-terminal domain-containing protein [Aestuariivita boseongensis]|uniref:5'-nucleotidase C-terminal domain-containing protein n=1 Tax=Aestuariivita boseongensis TaxID=1470562 RepID=UPI00155D8CEC|nr:5'-nucleotidase C-terminal domain-containing protein [Aestuariivita boseongensis]